MSTNKSPVVRTALFVVRTAACMSPGTFGRKPKQYVIDNGNSQQHHSVQNVLVLAHPHPGKSLGIKPLNVLALVVGLGA